MNYKSEVHKGIVHLWDLPEKKVYLDLEKNYKTEMLETAKKLTGGTLNSLSRRLGFPVKHRSSELLRSLKRKKSASLFVFKKISDFLNSFGIKKFSLENLEKQAILIKYNGNGFPIRNPKFPINFNSKHGAIVISAILHDGGMDKTYNEPFYSNLDFDIKKRVVSAVKEAVGDIHFVESYKQVQFPKIFGIILKLIGMAEGKKTLANPEIPSFLCSSSENVISEYVAQAIADDGTVYCNKRGYIEITLYIEMTNFDNKLKGNIKKGNLAEYAPNILKGDKIMFEKLGIRVLGPRFRSEYKWTDKENKKRHSFSWRIRVCGLENIKNLSEKIKIPMEHKQRNLERIVNLLYNK